MELIGGSCPEGGLVGVLCSDGVRGLSDELRVSGNELRESVRSLLGAWSYLESVMRDSGRFLDTVGVYSKLLLEGRVPLNLAMEAIKDSFVGTHAVDAVAIGVIAVVIGVVIHCLNSSGSSYERSKVSGSWG